MRVEAARIVAALAAFGLGMGTDAAAQVRASERSQVSQVIDGTTITVDYARPRVRGRTQIFGRWVHWGEVWTPGANMATTLEVDKEIELDGHVVPKGKYSMWMVVSRDDAWTMVLDPDWNRFHTMRPAERDGQIRYAIAATTSPHTEVLTFWFPEITATGGVLEMQWADKAVKLAIKVRPSRSIRLSRDEAAPYLGKYAVSRITPRVQPSTQPIETFEVVYADTTLMANWNPPPFPEGNRVYLVRIAPDWFVLGLLADGVMYDIMTEFVLEFSRVGPRADRFEVRAPGDRLMATAERTP